MTIHFETLGCKLNQIESESAANFFYLQGFSISMKPLTRAAGVHNDINLCIINTCTVTGKAEQKARRTIKLLLDVCPHAPLIVTGCYAELDASLIQSISERIIIIPGSKKGLLTEIPQLVLEVCNNISSNAEYIVNNETSQLFLSQLRAGIEAKKNIALHAQTTFRLSTDTFFQHSRSSIKIQDGCNNHCTYCRIRLARGTSVSLEPSEVLKRVKKLEQAGHKEVTITGVNLSQYKSVYNNQVMDIADLVSFLIENTLIISFRISSLYPERVDEKMCAVLDHDRIRPHFHLSVQSGSDSILRAMKRPYKAQQVFDAVKRLRTIKPLAFIACDIIAGFPGETEEDFDQTISLCKNLNFTWIHAFPFSARPGTEAFTMKPTVASHIASQRVLLLTTIAKEQKNAFIQKLVGTECKAIVEKRQGLPLRAVTENFLHAEIEIPDGMDSKAIKGKEIFVKLTGKSTLLNCEAKASLISTV